MNTFSVSLRSFCTSSSNSFLSIRRTPFRPQIARTAVSKQFRGIVHSAMTQSVDTANPLLVDSPFPKWDSVNAEHVVPAIRQLLEETNDAIDELEKNVEPTWSGLVEPLERIVDRLGRAWGTVSHLKAVKDTGSSPFEVGPG